MRWTLEGTEFGWAEDVTGRIVGAPCGWFGGMRGRGDMDAHGLGAVDCGGGEVGGDIAPGGRIGIGGRAALVGVAPNRCCRAKAEAWGSDVGTAPVPSGAGPRPDIDGG